MRTISVLLPAFLAGLAVALLTSGADARTAADAKSAKKSPAAKQAKRRQRPLTARRLNGRAHVPVSVLGPRWSQIGDGVRPGTATTTTTQVTYTVPPSTTATTTTPDTLALGVRLSEWSVFPTRGPDIEAGTYAVQLQNHGQDPHDLLIYRESDNTVVAHFPVTPKADPPGRPTTNTMLVNFTKPGRYQLFCTLVDSVNHRNAGMYSELSVVAP